MVPMLPTKTHESESNSQKTGTKELSEARLLPIGECQILSYFLAKLNLLPIFLPRKPVLDFSG